MNNQTISLYKTIIFLTSFCITFHTLTMQFTTVKNTPLDWRYQCASLKNSQVVPSNHLSNSQRELTTVKSTPLDWRNQCVPVKQETTPAKYLVDIQYILINAIKINAISTINNLLEINRLHQRYNIDFNTPYNDKKQTPLHLAAKLQHSDIMRILLENGAHQTIKDIQGKTPEFWLYKNIYQGGTPILSNNKIEKNKKLFFKIHNILLCNRLEKLNIYNK